MTELVDTRERERIRTDTAATLFVNAGAGSGKTAALIERVTTLVLRDGVRLSHIAAVTFTEKAGAELRDRLREEFERARSRGGSDPATADRTIADPTIADPAIADPTIADRALDDLDGAAIGTLHAFGQRLLTEHPIEAGLPPIIEVLDEVGSSVAFEERWSELQAELLGDDDIADALLLGMALGMTLDHIRSLALLLGKDWDLLEDRVLAAPPRPVEVPDVARFAARAREFVLHSEHCNAPDDKMLPKLHDLAALVDLVDAAPDTGAKLATLGRISALKFTFGQRGNWSVPIEEIKSAGTALAHEAESIVAAVLDQCLRQVTCWLAGRVLDAAEVRRRDGKLEFHDLLVLPRNLLRRDAAVRAALHEDYQRLLLDEFQDTDPIQIELAARICGGAAAGAPRWQDIELPPGRLFVVGDSKQSIYRFRRASIATYLDAEEHIGGLAGLTTNFRSVEPILDWVNSVFGTLIRYTPGQQPGYVPLSCDRTDLGGGPAVTALGARAHTDLPRAGASLLREREAADVAAVIREALGERWQVYDRDQDGWRDARPDDIAVLVPARTSLPFLEDALDSAQIPYRAEASSLVYQAAEVRSLLACARSVADSTDNLSLVTALRSPLFGCGDDDLWRWKQANGSFRVFAEIDPSHPLASGPVGTALTYLKRLYFDARWLAPSEVLAAIIADRRMFEVAAEAGPRARDSWRRLRFVVDQARAWSEVSHGGLRAYLAWAAHQGQEVSRVAEAVLPETDSHSVRVMTIHAAKGLEFPIVILSGMTAQGAGGRGVSLLWPPEGGYQVKLKKSVQTGDFATAVPIDEQMDDQEKLRLLYVAATRARDHLVVSVHRAEGSGAKTMAKLVADAAGITAAGARSFQGYPFDVSHPDGAAPLVAPPPYAEWLEGVTSARRRSEVVSAISASGLEGTEPEIVLDETADDGLAKGARDLELPPWSKGRYGSAIGRAVHGVLQVVDLMSRDGVAGAVAAQAVAEGVVGQEKLVGELVESALASDLVGRAAAREHWRETYVGTVRADGTVLEGYVDLVFRDDDGTLVVVDYKTDAVPSGAIQSRVTYYTPQMAAYCEALAAATSSRVSATLLFLNPEVSVAVDVPVPTSG